MSHLGYFIILMLILIAVILDIRTYRISNRLILAGLSIGLCYQWGICGQAGLYQFLTGITVPVVLLFLLFLFRVLGAGDIKLFSVAGGVLGVPGIYYYMMYSFVFSACFAAVKLYLNHNLWHRLQYLADYISDLLTTKVRKPYRSGHLDESCMIHFSIGMLPGVILYMGVFW